MGSVVQLADRRTSRMAIPVPDLIEISFVAPVGGILIVILCERGNETSGPYFVTLRTAGLPDNRILTVSAPATTTWEDLLDRTLCEARVVYDSLLHADRHAHLLPSQLPPPAEPA